MLRTISAIKLDLVLSGHRHRPWRWKLNETEFLFSGAVSTRRLRGFFENSYNVIDVKDGEITPKLKVVGGEMINFDRIIKMEPLFRL